MKMFGLGPKWLDGVAARIAQKHGCDVVNHTEPNGARRHWLTTENSWGAEQRAADCIVALKAAGKIRPAKTQ